MKKIDYKTLDIKPHNMIFVITTSYGYEEERIILLEIDDATDNYVVLRGYHCSCYGFDDVEWEAIAYSYDELGKLANAEYNKDGEEAEFWNNVKKYYNFK